MPRLFVAILLPEEVKKEIARRVRPLQVLPCRVKWVEEENYHLTLKFLGEVEEEAVQEISAALEALAPAHVPFSLSYGDWGVFPGRARPRVLWMGLKGDLPRLLALQAAVEDRLAALGYPREEKEFHPHITLGRVKSPEGAALLVAKMEEVLPRGEVGSFRVAEFHLMESRLSRAGPAYSPRGSYRLATPS